MIRLRAALVAATIASLATAASAASRLGDAARSADLVVEGRIAAAPDEFGLTLVTPGRAARRPAGLEASLLVRLPRPLREGTSWLLLLVPDELARSLGAWAPVDPDFGVVPLDGRAGRPDDLLALADLAVDPPADPAALGERLAALVGHGDAPTAFALEELLQRPEQLARVAPRLGDELRSMLATRRVSPPTAALAVRALPYAAGSADDVRLVDLVASEAPPIVVEAAAESLRRLATPATAEHLEHALGAAPSAAIPGLLRLAGPASARSLVPQLCAQASSSRQEARLAAIASLAELRDPACDATLRALASHDDEETARAARSALGEPAR